MARARQLAGDSLSLLISQAIVIVAQLGYAVVTARTVLPDQFGYYAIALGLAGVLSLFSSAGLGGAVARLPELRGPIVGGLVTVSWLVGLSAAIAALLVADPWARLWGVPEAASTVRWSAAVVVLAPYLSLLNGLVRRVGRTRSLAVAALIGALFGMALALPVVVWDQSARSLLLSGFLAALIQVLLLGRLLRHMARPRGVGRDVTSDLVFASRVTGASALSYLASSAPSWGLTRALGAPELGAYNRAVVLVQVPLENLQRAVTQVIYPEFRHDADSIQRTRVLWPDLMELVAWTTVPVAACVAASSPWVVPLILGPGWESAAQFAPWLAMAAGIAPATVVLGIALEASGRLALAWGGLVATVFVALGGALLAVVLRSATPVLVAVVLVPVVRHALQLKSASGAGLLSVRPIALGYLRVLLAGVATAAAVLLGVFVANTLAAPAALGAVLAGGCAMAGLAALAWSGHLGVGHLLVRFGLR